MAKSKMTPSRLSGTPWHTEYLRMSDDDHRRDKRRCRYYRDGFCNYLNRTCGSSTYCKAYKESMSEERSNKAWVEKTKKDIVKEKALQVNPAVRVNTVERGDRITVQAYSNKRIIELNILREGTLAPVAELCLGKQLFSSVTYNGFSYKITRIKKNAK